MANDINQRLLVYISRNNLQIFSPTIPTILNFIYPATAIRHGEFINADLFTTSLASFLATNKLTAGKVLLVLSPDIYFDKIFQYPQPVQQQPVNTPAPNQKNEPPKQTSAEKMKTASENLLFQEQQMKKFTEMVPYDSLTEKIYKLPNGFRLFAANRTFYEKVITAFKKCNYITESVVSQDVFGDVSKTWNSLNGENAKIMYTSPDNHKNDNLLLEVQKPVEEDMNNTLSEPVPEKKTNKKRLIAMVGLLVGLLGFTVYFYLQTFSAPPPKKIIKKSTPIIISTPTVMPSSSVDSATGSAELTTKRPDVQIRINHANTTLASEKARELRTVLLTLGYKNILVSTQSQVTSRTVIILSPSVIADMKEEIIRVIDNEFPTTSVQEEASQFEDIIITIGNN
jgi:hypothetical protein